MEYSDNQVDFVIVDNGRSYYGSLIFPRIDREHELVQWILNDVDMTAQMPLGLLPSDFQ